MKRPTACKLKPWKHRNGYTSISLVARERTSGKSLVPIQRLVFLWIIHSRVNCYGWNKDIIFKRRWFKKYYVYTILFLKYSKLPTIRFVPYPQSRTNISCNNWRTQALVNYSSLLSNSRNTGFIIIQALLKLNKDSYFVFLITTMECRSRPTDQHTQ